MLKFNAADVDVKCEVRGQSPSLVIYSFEHEGRRISASYYSADFLSSKDRSPCINIHEGKKLVGGRCEEPKEGEIGQLSGNSYLQHQMVDFYEEWLEREGK